MPPATRRSPRAAKKAAPRHGSFARLRAEAAKAAPDVEPYVLYDDDGEPLVEIPAPDTAEQQLALASMFDNTGSFALADAKLILETVCGDAFGLVWDLTRHEKLPVLLALIKDMGEHFQEQGALVADVEEDDFPGGS